MSKNLQVVFLLDITGSMGNQLDGVKAMILDFCKQDKPGVDVHVWPFTETDPKFTALELSSYVSKIRLSSPPDFPNVTNAYGDDGPENVVAAVVQLLHKFGPSDNILTFLITDELPHHQCFGSSSTARAELNWLADRGHIETDIYQLLNKVVFSLNITIVPVLYNSGKNGKWYEQAAATTDGIMLSPTVHDSKILARGLTAIMNSIQNMVNGGTATPYSSSDFAGFSIRYFDGDYDALTEDKVTTTTGNYSTGFEEINAGLLGLLDSTRDRFSGKRSSKRCRTVNPSAIQASIKVLVLTMLKLVKSKLDPECKQLTAATQQLVSIIKSKPSDTTEYELNLLDKYFKNEGFELLYPFSERQDNEEILQCVISLDSALDALNELEQLPKSEDDIKCWMDIVLDSTLCRFIDVKFPVDALGCPDFMDSWSAVINKISLSTTISAYSAIKLRDSGYGVYRDPLTRESFSSAVIVAHPNDRILSTAYRVLSALPTLQGLVQGYLVSGGFRVFPSLAQGLQASTLMKIVKNVSLDKSLTQAEWEFSRSLIFSLQVSLSSTAKNVFDSLSRNQCFNPADNISKLVAGLIRFKSHTGFQGDLFNDLLLQLFEEISSDHVMLLERIRGKTPSDLLTDAEIVDFIVSPNDIDPLQEVHQAETITTDQIGDLSSLESKIESTTFYSRILHTFTNLSNLLLSNVYEKNVDNMTLNLLTAGQMIKIVGESVILKKRTGRYELLEKDGNWRKLTLDEIKIKRNSALIDMVCNVYKARIIEWDSQRQIFAKQQLFKLASSITDNSHVGIVDRLKKLEYHLLGKAYKLSRMDSLEFIQALPKELVNTIGRAFVVGAWTSEPATGLRRVCKALLDCFAGIEDLDAIENDIMAKQKCSRVVGTNRNGHSIDWPFPGCFGWNEAYGEFRLKGGKNLRALEKNRKYTLLIQDIEKDLVQAKKVGACGKRLIKSFLNLDFNPDVDILSVVERIYALSATLDELDVTKIDEIVLKTRLSQPLRRVKEFLANIEGK